MRGLVLHKQIFSRLLITVSGLLALAIFSCSSQSQLVPGPGANAVPGNSEAAEITVEGVHLVVDAAAWRGNQAILQDITPLKVTIENNSGQPLLIRYKDFAITSNKGKYYAALPPYQIEGSVSAPYAAAGYPVIVNPEFGYGGFLIAPYYHDIYPNIPDWRSDRDFQRERRMRHNEGMHHRGGDATRYDSSPGGGYKNDEGDDEDEGDDFGDDFGDDWPFYDPYWYGGYYSYWYNIKLPTPGMLRAAMPEGVIQDGGHLSGFLYFEEVSPGLKMVDFRVDLVNALDEKTFGTILMPFAVVKQ